MARRRIEGVSLPRGVQIVKKASGRTYYYWAPGRSTESAGTRSSLGSDPTDPEFWRALQRAKGAGPAQAGTFDALIAAYRASPEWNRLRPASRKDYNIQLEKLGISAGDRMVTALTSPDIYELRDGLSATPVSANHMITVLRNLLSWGVQRGYRKDNPAIGVKRLEIDEEGATPWPEEGYAFVRSKAPEDLRRMAFLGRATGQRASDLVRMRPVDLASDGINVRIAKRRDKLHFVPLTAAQMREIESWSVKDLDFFLKSTHDKPYKADHLNSRWNRWRNSEQAKPVRALKITIHGLRATAVADRRRGGTEDGAIADELGMSPQMVARYVRFADTTRSGRASRDRRERAENEFENSVATLKTRDA